MTHVNDGKDRGSLRTLLVDDHEVVRKGIAMLLETEFSLDVTEVATAEDAIRWVRDEAIGLVFLDVRLRGHDGLWALEQIRKVRPNVPILMMSTFDDQDVVQKAIELGANGYLLKEANLSQLADAINTAVNGGGLYLHPSVAQKVFALRQAGGPGGVDLSDRERAVLTRVVDGATNEHIASELYVSEKTVKSHLSSVFRKLGVSNRTQAAATAIRDGIVKLETSLAS